MQWIRCTPLAWGDDQRREERWECWEGERLLHSSRVDVRLGKPLDVLGLKGTAVQEARAYAREMEAAAARLYRSELPPTVLTACPCCGRTTDGAPVAIVVHGVAHHRCPHCAHVYVREQPHAEARARLLSESEEHSAVYTDPASVELRITQVVAPKVAWINEVYGRLHGRACRRVLDVGAGGGHLVAALRRAGVEADGFEVSRSARAFAQEAFGVTLRDTDFLGTPASANPYDVVTFFGLLEYTPQPRQFLEAARRWMHSSQGLLVVEVPRVDCLSTAVQRELSDDIARHFGPSSHLHCFSDASVATCLHLAGFETVAAWYFGMDAYELLVQQSLALQEHSLLSRLVTLVPGLQQACDGAALCDDLVLAAVPRLEAQGEDPRRP